MLTLQKKKQTDVPEEKVEVESKLHTMQIVDYDRGTQIVNWNGEVAEREHAKQVFDELMRTGAYFAYATVTEAPEVTSGAATEAPPAPGKRQIQRFDPEAERIYVTPRVVGG